MNALGKTVVSRADLLRLSNHFGEKALDRLSIFAGYFRKPDEKKVKPPIDSSGFTGPTTPIKSPIIAHPIDNEIDTPFWLPVSLTTLFSETQDTDSKPKYYIEAEPIEDKEICADRSLGPPSQSPLCPWSRLWPFLRSALGAHDFRGAVDMPEAVRWVSEMRPMRQLPRKQRRGWARRSMLIVDFDTRLVPFWQDVNTLYRHLAGIRGENGLDLVTFLQGPCGPAYRGGDDGSPPIAFKPPEPGQPILIISDLGLFGHSARIKQEWLRFGWQLHQAGCAPVVLTPAPRRLWTDELAKVYRLACWDRGQRLPKISGPQSAGSKPLAPEENRNGTELLISLLSPAIRVEPALLRAARLLLPIDQADAGDEAAVWHHNHVRQSYNGFSFDSRHIAGWRKAFIQHHGGDLRQRLVDLIQTHHRHLSPAVYLEEQLIAAMVLNKLPPREAEQFFWRCLKTNAESDFADKPNLAAYLQRVPHRHEHDPGMWKSEVMCALHVTANRDAWQKGRLVLPQGSDAACVAFLAEQGAIEGYTLYHQGPHFIARSRAPYSGDAPPAAGSPVVDLFSSDGVLQVRILENKDDASAIAVNLKSATPVPIEIPEEGELLLRTTHQEVTLKSMRIPNKWAQGWGRNEQGLFLELPTGGEPRKVRWLVPGRYALSGRTGTNDLETLGPEPPSPSNPWWIEIQDGFWWDEQDYLQLLAVINQKPEWTHNFKFGKDKYGFYGDFSYKGITQRMRWIMPGEFMMGSPKNEHERENDEIQHQVILTRGFWLAETTCTQALWQAVMGDTPSRFKGDDRPVETVSWDDCQTFIAKLNESIPGLNVHLPTEAQWEYACRAGTTTPFHFGETITTDQVNFNGNHPYNNGPKGEYREQTVPVKSFPCNAWGLYEMHGNVWEWCADWYDEYPKEAVVDPVGPSSGRDRVLRGGSWICHGGFVRSAYRDRYEPDERLDNFGLRLARGQTSQAGQSSGRAGGVGLRDATQPAGPKKSESAQKSVKRKTGIFKRTRKK